MYFILNGATFSNNIGTVNIETGTVTPPSGGGSEPETPVNPTNYTFTINPTPTSATVTLSASGYTTVSGTGSKSITVANGTQVAYTVSKTGYITKTGTIKVSYTQSMGVSLVSESGGSGGGAGGITNYALPYTSWNWKSGFGDALTLTDNSFSWSVESGTQVVLGHKYALSDIPFKIGDTIYFGIRDLVKEGGNFSLCFFKADNTEITPRLNATIESPISYLIKEIPAETARIEIRLHGSTMTSCSGGKAYLSTVPFDENTVWAN